MPAVWLVVTSMLAVVACAPQPLTVTREPVELRLVAAESCAPLARELADAYEKTYPWVAIEVQALNSALATEALRTGEADVALIPWLDEEAGAAGVLRYNWERQTGINNVSGTPTRLL